jgi:hypothetical protein
LVEIESNYSSFLYFMQTTTPFATSPLGKNLKPPAAKSPDFEPISIGL